jgi:hypothetical protein
MAPWARRGSKCRFPDAGNGSVFPGREAARSAASLIRGLDEVLLPEPLAARFRVCVAALRAARGKRDQPCKADTSSQLGFPASMS